MRGSIVQYIDVIPEIRGGRPVYKDTRILVSYIKDHLKKGYSKEEVKAIFPEVDEKFIDLLMGK